MKTIHLNILMAISIACIAITLVAETASALKKDKEPSLAAEEAAVLVAGRKESLVRTAGGNIDKVYTGLQPDERAQIIQNAIDAEKKPMQDLIDEIDRIVMQLHHDFTRGDKAAMTEGFQDYDVLKKRVQREASE